MLWKLSLTGLKSRKRDYAVLFSGLLFASAIFYMFLTIAANPHFITTNLKMSKQILSLAFGFGAALLALITLVYIVYANSFLLSMRQRDYGMYMMLGARSGKIGRLIFSETMVVGLLASVIGIGLGVGLTELVANLIVNQLGLTIHHFSPFYPLAALLTIAFFLLLFFLAALWNRYKLGKSQVINLLREQSKPVKLRVNPTVKTVEAILGVLLLAVGYWAMANYQKLMTNSIIIGFFTIIAGSYLVFDSLFVAGIAALQKSNFKFKNLRIFTLGQLRFRISSYTKILATISWLFAMALGAITVGLRFDSLTDQALDSTYYDATVISSPDVKKQLKKLPVTNQVTLSYKKDQKNNLYFPQTELQKGHYKYQQFYLKKGQQTYRTKTITAAGVKAGKEDNFQLKYLVGLDNATALVVSDQKYQSIPAAETKIHLLRIKNFRASVNNIEKLQKVGQVNFADSKVAAYRMVSAAASGFEFMGFFLGLAFLGMLASTLMFKVLSGAAADKPRYLMLKKIGTRTRLLKHSVAQEIGVLFALPAGLGIIDVLFGLQFFKSVVVNPYARLWLPFSIFLILYLLYYLLTVQIYKRIVLK